MDAFDVEAVDYLLKPFEEKRFRRTMDRVRKMLMNVKNNDKEEEKFKKAKISKLLIDDGERMVLVAPESIYYAVPNKRLLEIHTEDKVIFSRMTLPEWPL